MWPPVAAGGAETVRMSGARFVISSGAQGQSPSALIAPRRVCVKVASLRPKYTDLRDWMAQPCNVYAGRRGRVWIHATGFAPTLFVFSGSVWENPFKINAEMSLEESLARYELKIRETWNERGLVQQLSLLSGKEVGCYCPKDQNCHVDIILRLWKENILKIAVELKVPLPVGH